MKLNRTATALIAGSAILTLAPAGCSPDDNAAAEATESAISATTEATPETEKSDAAAQLANAYIREKPTDEGVTAIFGTLTDNTGKDIKVSPFKLRRLKEGTKFERHNTKDGKMSKVPEGLTIPVDGELTLEPGSTYFMITDNDEATDVGAGYKFIIGLSGDSSITQDVEVRIQPADEEGYGSDGDLNGPKHMGGGEMDHLGH